MFDTFDGLSLSDEENWLVKLQFCCRFADVSKGYGVNMARIPILLGFRRRSCLVFFP